MNGSPELPEPAYTELVQGNRPYLEDELVVDLHQLGVVRDALTGLQVRFSTAFEDDLLGLALLTGLRGGPGSLDKLLDELRTHFRTTCGGWVPALGKHRGIEGIIPTGSKPMGIGVAGSKPMFFGGKPTPVGGFVLETKTPAAEAGAGVRIGMIDTPLYRHEALDGHGILTAHWLRAGSASLPDRAGHGTFVANLILREAPGARLTVRGVLDRTTGRASEWETAREIVRLGREVDILNLSLGSYTEDGEISLVIRRAIERLPRDVLVIAAAGNHGGAAEGSVPGPDSPVWPGALPGVVAVGAVGGLIDEMTAGGGRPEFSPRLPWITCVAPGVEVTSAFPSPTGNTYMAWSGTSFAAATTTGAVAARTVPGRVSAADALERVLDDPSSVVKRYVRPS